MTQNTTNWGDRWFMVFPHWLKFINIWAEPSLPVIVHWLFLELLTCLLITHYVNLFMKTAIPNLSLVAFLEELLFLIVLWIQIDLYLLLDESFATLDPLQSLQPDILRHIFHIIDQSYQHCALSRVKLRYEHLSCLVLVQLHLKNTLWNLVHFCTIVNTVTHVFKRLDLHVLFLML